MKTGSKSTASRGAGAASGYAPTSETPTAKTRRRRTTRLCDSPCPRAAATSPPRCNGQRLARRGVAHPGRRSLTLARRRSAEIFYETPHFTQRVFYVLWIFIDARQNHLDAVTTNCRSRRRSVDPPSVVGELALELLAETLQRDVFAFLCHLPYSIDPRGQCHVCVNVDMSMFVLLCSSPL